MATATGTHRRDSTLMAETQHVMTAVGLRSPYAALHQQSDVRLMTGVCRTEVTLTLTAQGIERGRHTH